MSKKMNLLILALFICSGLALSACETMEGAGQDIEAAGESIQDAAN